MAMKMPSACPMIVASMLILTGNEAATAVVSNSNIGFGPAVVGPITSLGGNYSAIVKQNMAGDYTEAGFAYTPANGSVPAMLAVIFVNTDEGTDWYLANAGDAFSASTIDAGQFPLIYKGTKTRPFFQSQTVTIPLGSFFVGVNTGVGFPDGWPNRNVFGWLELNNTGTQLLPLANAVAYNEPGIIIGTTTPAPEPATLAILAPLSLLPLRHSKTRPRDRRQYHRPSKTWVPLSQP